jgi:hypothetical protein
MTLKLKIVFLSYFFLLIVFVFFNGCRKENTAQKKSYTGNFLFTVHNHTTSFNGPATDTTYTYQGTISISGVAPYKTDKKHVFLKIYYTGSSDLIYAEVDKDGHFISTSPNFSCAGFSSADQLDFVYSVTGVSHSNVNNVHGVRR